MRWEWLYRTTTHSRPAVLAGIADDFFSYLGGETRTGKEQSLRVRSKQKPQSVNSRRSHSSNMTWVGGRARPAAEEKVITAPTMKIIMTVANLIGRRWMPVMAKKPRWPEPESRRGQPGKTEKEKKTRYSFPETRLSAGDIVDQVDQYRTDNGCLPVPQTVVTTQLQLTRTVYVPFNSQLYEADLPYLLSNLWSLSFVSFRKILSTGTGIVCIHFILKHYFWFWFFPFFLRPKFPPKWLVERIN